MTDQPTTQPTSAKKTRTKKNHPGLAAIVGGGFTLKATDVAPDAVIRKAANRKDTAPRDQFQKQVDADVKANANHPKNRGKDTRAAAKDGFYTNLKLSEYIVPTQAVDEVLHMLDRATGTGGTAPGKQKIYRKGTHTSGNVRIQWAILGKAPAKPKPTPSTPAS